MKKPKHAEKLLILFLFLVLSTGHVIPCSMFKITLYGKTMVGNNEDSWRLTSRIWFEKGREGKYGGVYVGYSDLFPQGGMNEAGLAFDGFAVYPKQLKDVSPKRKIDNPTNFIKEIMQNCKSVDEVRDIANKYDRRNFNSAMFLFVEKSGKYLVVESDTLIFGNDEKYVLSNFCPSITNDLTKVKIDRYQRGRTFLENKEDTSLNFCKSVMDTMHECRARLGDGTLYTSIYDLNEGLVYLYFYHDYENVVKFNLQQELKKGNHIYTMPNLFPKNKEYATLYEYETPITSKIILLSLFAFGFLFSFTILFFLLGSFIKLFKSKNALFHKTDLISRLILLTANIFLTAYIFVLVRNPNIVYGEAPFRMTQEMSFLNFAAYIPIIVLILFIPLALCNALIFRKHLLSKFSRCIFTLNTIGYLAILLLFGYWHLYSVL